MGTKEEREGENAVRETEHIELDFLKSEFLEEMSEKKTVSVELNDRQYVLLTRWRKELNSASDADTIRAIIDIIRTGKVILITGLVCKLKEDGKDGKSNNRSKG